MMRGSELPLLFGYAPTTGAYSSGTQSASQIEYRRHQQGRRRRVRGCRERYSPRSSPIAVRLLLARIAVACSGQHAASAWPILRWRLSSPLALMSTCMFICRTQSRCWLPCRSCAAKSRSNSSALALMHNAVVS